MYSRNRANIAFSRAPPSVRRVVLVCVREYESDNNNDINDLSHLHIFVFVFLFLFFALVALYDNYKRPFRCLKFKTSRSYTHTRGRVLRIRSISAHEIL